MIREEGECDRCKQRLEEGRYVRMTSLEHVLRKASPQCRLELCAACYVELRNWTEEGAK